ncbi:MAG: hypothetical protein AAFP02_13660 [Bacteroidota bacterium]
MSLATPSATCICTIVTESHLDYALALFLSYRRFEAEIPLYILVVDQDEVQASVWEGVHFVERSVILENTVAQRMQTRYVDEPDYLRWALKPVLMEYLLEEKGYEQVVFADCDLCFYQKPDPIWQHLKGANMLLSPHWRSAKPEIRLDVSQLASGVYSILLRDGERYFVGKFVRQ